MVSQPKDDVPLEPAPVSAGGTYSLQSVRVGCKVYIRRPTGTRSSSGEEEFEERIAEILSIRNKPSTSYTVVRSVPDPASLSDSADTLEFFVHWDAFNKRLDGWVSGSRIVLSRDMEWPRPKAPGQPKKLAGAALKAQQRLQVQKGKGMGMGKGKGVSSRGKTPRPAGQSLLKKASVNAARAASSKAPTDMLGTGMLGPDSPPYTFEIGSPTASLDLPFMLKRKRSNGEDTDPDADGSVMDLEDDADAEGSLDVSVQGDHDQDQDMDIDADADGSEDEQDPDHDDEHEPSFDLGSTESGAVPPPPPLATFSKEAEIEKLRTSGSMTQSVSEVARVKNLNRLQIGAHEVDAWYFSPYPREYAHLPVLYICEFCLFYFPTQFMLGRHRKRCKLLHPPGNEIYRHEDISFYELDGKRQLQYCRNLSLLSKCFLDHKTLYYDVTPFLYYVMCQRDSSGSHLIGYFSKEKESAESYNVACILTLPQHQRFGFGKLLIEFSYELSKREGKLGSPEKPLSDLGLLGYRAYWAEMIVELLLQESLKGEVEISVDDIAQRTSVTHADVMNTCFTLQLFKHYKGQNVICLSDAVLERHDKAKARRKRRIKPEALVWKPPVFTRDQLRFGW